MRIFKRKKKSCENCNFFSQVVIVEGTKIKKYSNEKKCSVYQDRLPIVPPLLELIAKKCKRYKESK